MRKRMTESEKQAIGKDNSEVTTLHTSALSLIQKPPFKETHITKTACVQLLKLGPFTYHTCLTLYERSTFFPLYSAIQGTACKCMV